MKKAKVYLWTEDTKIVRMGTEEADGVRVKLENGSLTNVCTVLQAMMPTNDVELLIHLAVNAVLNAPRVTSQKDLETLVYNAIMAQSIFNK